MPRLTILSGKREGESVDLPEGTYQVGTGRAADIQLRDKGVGFKHAQLVVDGDEVFIEDLKSRGGTFLNGEKLEPNDRRQVTDTDDFQIGTVELKLEGASSNGAASATAEAPAEDEPAAEEPEAEEPAVAEPEPEPEPVAEDPEPVSVPAVEIDATAVEASLTPVDQLPDDPAVLKDHCRALERALAEKTQEAKAYEEALEANLASGGGGAGDAYDDGMGGYAASVETDLEGRILELQHQADELSSHVEEKNEVIKQLEKEIELLREKNKEAIADVDRQLQAASDGMVRSLERVEDQRHAVEQAETEVATFQQVNAELLLENEEMKERLEALSYQLEQEHSRRGELVRTRIVELRDEVARLEESNTELRTLVEAYEEKIDELDERVEELEGETEAHEQLVGDLRKELAKVKNDRDVMVRTLRNKVKTLEQKVERAQGESARARAAAEAS